MTITEKRLLSLLIVGALVIGFFASQLMKDPIKVNASVAAVEAYQATSTRNSTGDPMASTTKLASNSSRIPGVLGSFVITGAGAAPVTFYDATTSDATLRGNRATSSLKVIANFPASTAAGTYTIDGVFNDGLLYDVTGSSSAVPTSTITWKLY